MNPLLSSILLICVAFSAIDAGVVYRGIWGTYLTGNSDATVSATIFPSEWTVTYASGGPDPKYYMTTNIGGPSNAYLSLSGPNPVMTSSTNTIIMEPSASTTTLQFSKYASARPDNSVTLVTSAAEWEVWTKVSCSGLYAGDSNNCGKCAWKCQNGVNTCIQGTCECGVFFTGTLCEIGNQAKYFIKSALYSTRYMMPSTTVGPSTSITGVLSGYDSWFIGSGYGGKYSIAMSNMQYLLGVVASGTGYGNVYTTTNNLQWEAFDIISTGGNNVYIKNTETGRYLGMDSSFNVYSTNSSPGSAETFTLVAV